MFLHIWHECVAFFWFAKRKHVPGLRCVCTIIGYLQVMLQTFRLVVGPNAYWTGILLAVLDLEDLQIFSRFILSTRHHGTLGGWSKKCTILVNIEFNVGWNVCRILCNLLGYTRYYKSVDAVLKNVILSSCHPVSPACALNWLAARRTGMLPVTSKPPLSEVSCALGTLSMRVISCRFLFSPKNMTKLHRRAANVLGKVVVPCSDVVKMKPRIESYMFLVCYFHEC